MFFPVQDTETVKIKVNCSVHLRPL